MAVTPQNFGPCRIFGQFWADNNGNWGDPLELGYSENGVDVSEETRQVAVATDDEGGQAGNEFDFQEMGDRHLLRMSISRWEAAVLDRMKYPWPLAAGELIDLGVPRPTGELRFVNGGFFRLVLLGDTKCRVYGKVYLPGEPRTVNLGARHSLAGIVATCLPARWPPASYADNRPTRRLYIEKTGTTRYVDAVSWWTGRPAYT